LKEKQGSKGIACQFSTINISPSKLLIFKHLTKIAKLLCKPMKVKPSVVDFNSTIGHQIGVVRKIFSTKNDVKFFFCYHT